MQGKTGNTTALVVIRCYTRLSFTSGFG